MCVCRRERREGEARRRRIVFADEPARFHAELGKIGEQFVGMVADTPACVRAFRAWCAVFMEEWELLKGSDGGEFSLEKELTWELFREVLWSMPGGKAVGAGCSSQRSNRKDTTVFPPALPVLHSSCCTHRQQASRVRVCCKQKNLERLRCVFSEPT